MKKILSLKRKYFICAAALLLVSGAAFFFLKTCLPSSENKEFESYIEDIFQQEMKTNTLNLHYTLAYPESLISPSFRKKIRLSTTSFPLNFPPSFLWAVPIFSRNPLGQIWASRPSFPYFWQNIPSALLQISRIIFLFWQIFRNTSRVSWNLKKRRLKKGCL